MGELLASMEETGRVRHFRHQNSQALEGAGEGRVTTGEQLPGRNVLGLSGGGRLQRL